MQIPYHREGIDRLARELIYRQKVEYRTECSSKIKKGRNTMLKPFRPVLKVWLYLLLALGLLGGASPVRAQSNPTQSPTPVHSSEKSTVSVSTTPFPPLVVLLNEKLVSGKGKAGEVIRFTVANELRAADGTTVLVPKGATAEGILLESSGPKNYGRPGKIRLTCDMILLNGGKVLPIVLRSKEGIHLGGDNRGLLNLIRVPIDILGTGLFVVGIIGVESNTGWDALGAGITAAVGATLVACGELIHGIIGYFVHGDRLTLEPGTPFVVELAGVPKPADALP